MTRDDILRMAREAGFVLSSNATDEAMGGFSRFAALVAAAEHEACAQSCVEISKHYWMGDCQFEAATRCAAAIRERGAR